MMSIIIILMKLYNPIDRKRGSSQFEFTNTLHLVELRTLVNLKFNNHHEDKDEKQVKTIRFVLILEKEKFFELNQQGREKNEINSQKKIFQKVKEKFSFSLHFFRCPFSLVISTPFVHSFDTHLTFYLWPSTSAHFSRFNFLFTRW